MARKMSVLFMFFLVISLSCQRYNLSEKRQWISTWSTSQQLVEQRNLPPEPGLSDNTIRQVVCISLGGEKFRVSFSNQFSTNPVEIRSAHMAVSLGADTIDLATDRILTFSGMESIMLQAGGWIMSDPVELPLKPRAEVAITTFFGSISADVTGHPGSRTTSYIVKGEAVSAPNIPGAVTTDHWYNIDGIEVLAEDSTAVIAVLGNSITDGRGSGTNKQNRWPDELAKRLLANPSTKNIAVINQGIGGNCVLRECLGPAAISRFDRDILNQKGVLWLIILEGINDIGGSKNAEEVSANLINGYDEMINRAHTKDIRVLGATLLPFAGSFYDSDEHQKAWKTVNEWIRSSGRFDSVIDLAKALEDPANPGHLLPAADTGDHLHPNETGHRMIAEAVDLNLFR